LQGERREKSGGTGRVSKTSARGRSGEEPVEVGAAARSRSRKDVFLGVARIGVAIRVWSLPKEDARTTGEMYESEECQGDDR